MSKEEKNYEISKENHKGFFQKSGFVQTYAICGDEWQVYGKSNAEKSIGKRWGDRIFTGGWTISEIDKKA